MLFILLLLLLYRPRSSTCRCFYKLGHDHNEWSKKFDRQLFSRFLRIDFVMAGDATMRPLLIGSAGTYLGCLNWPQKTTRYCRVRRKLFMVLASEFPRNQFHHRHTYKCRETEKRGRSWMNYSCSIMYKNHRPAVE